MSMPITNTPEFPNGRNPYDWRDDIRGWRVTTPWEDNMGSSRIGTGTPGNPYGEPSGPNVPRPQVDNSYKGAYKWSTYLNRMHDLQREAKAKLDKLKSGDDPAATAEAKQEYRQLLERMKSMKGRIRNTMLNNKERFANDFLLTGKRTKQDKSKEGQILHQTGKLVVEDDGNAPSGGGNTTPTRTPPRVIQIDDYDPRFNDIGTIKEQLRNQYQPVLPGEPIKPRFIPGGPIKLPNGKSESAINNARSLAPRTSETAANQAKAKAALNPIKPTTNDLKKLIQPNSAVTTTDPTKNKTRRRTPQLAVRPMLKIGTRR